MSAGTAAPTGEPSVGNVLLFVVSGLAFAAPMLVCWVMARRRVPGRRSSWGVAILLTLATVAASATFAVSLVHQFGTLPLALVLLLVRPASTRQSDPATAVWPPTHRAALG